MVGVSLNLEVSESIICIELSASGVFFLHCYHSLPAMLLFFSFYLLVEGLGEGPQPGIHINKKLPNAVNENGEILPELLFELSNDVGARWLHESTPGDVVC